MRGKRERRRRPPAGLGVAAAVALAAAWLGVPAAAGERTVVVLLFDGLGATTLEAAPMPAFERLRREGAWTDAMEVPFPSLSLISGVTLSTGCWPERHGVVTNLFLDPERGVYDHDRDADWLDGCEHLHVAAERQGVRAAALGWYGARSGSRGALASVVRDTPPGQVYPSDGERAAEVVELLGRTDPERPRLILAYFTGPDHAQHHTGFDSEETRAAVAAVDAAVARVLAAVESGPHADSTAVLVTTDHGMREVGWIVNVERLLHWHDIDARALSSGTTAFLYFDDPAAVDRGLEALSGYDEFEVLRRGALPDYARLGSGPRVGDAIVSARPPYFIEDTSLWPWYLRWLGRWGPRFAPVGPLFRASHGYPPRVDGVAGVLYAWGDGIARGREISSARSIDVHPTVTELLGIGPGEPVDGRPLRELQAADP